MPIPHVWTEREPNGAAWTYCTWCSILMVVVGSGHTDFPLGMYTAGERLAFRGGDPRLNFSGGVERAKARYDVTVISPPPFSQSGLRAALSQPNRVWAVAGKLANFPVGHRLRRWQPGFIDFHAVAVASDASARLTWLDPLAPDGYPGEPCTPGEVADLFALGNYPNDARYMTMGAGGAMPVLKALDGYPDGTNIEFVKGKQYQFFAFDDAGARTSWAWTPPAGTSAPTEGLVTFLNEGPAHHLPTVYDGARMRANAYLPKPYAAAVFPPKPPPSGFTQEDIDAAVDEAISGRDDAWKTSIIAAVEPEASP